MIHQPQMAWLRQQGEVMATGALALLLHDQDLEAAFREMLCGLGGGRFDRLQWSAEHTLAGSGRVDLAGSDGDCVRVFVEGKLGATLDPKQIRCYAEALGSTDAGLLAILVPDRRKVEAVLRIAQAYPKAPGAGTTMAALGSVTILVLTWEHVLKGLRQASEDAPPVLGDVEQLASLVDALEHFDVPAFSPADLGAAWQQRERHWVVLADRVTLKLRANDRVLPSGQERPQVWRRYLEPEEAGAALSVGVRPPMQDAATPLWVRYHRRTPGFAAVRSRLSASAFAEGVREEGGHIWLPLQPRCGESAAGVVEDLVEQVLRIDEIARDNTVLRDRLLEHAT